MKILLVEDNANTRKMLRKILTASFRKELTIRECDDGEAALELHRTFRPDVTLMDIQLRHGDGLSATREICRVDRDARVVIITAYTASEYQEASLRAGACGFVTKDNLLALPEMLDRKRR